MIRRWMIRSIFIGLCVVCVGAWVGSFGRSYGMEYKPGLCYTAYLTDGRIFAGRSEPFFEDPSGLKFVSFRRDATFAAETDKKAKYHGLGFSFRREETYWWGTVPLWFTGVGSGLVLGWVWRKTRAKAAGRAFPVEPAAPNSSSAKAK